MKHIPGEMARRLREFDWSATPIGPPERWPIAWRNALRLILDSSFPAALALGPELTYIPNDAFIPLGGPDRHPSAIGRSAKEVWQEIYQPYLEPRFDETLSTGQPTGEIDLLLPLKRSGYLEETYMRFSFAAVRDDQDMPSGILCTATENTGLVIQSRQIDCLRRLATGCSSAVSPEEACDLAAALLEQQERDLPFALLYLYSGKSGRVEMTASIGLTGIPPGVPRVITSASTVDPWRLADVAYHGETSRIADVGALIGPALRRPRLVPQEAIAVPVSSGGDGTPAGILVAGLNPMRPAPESAEFHKLVAAHLERAVGSARMKQLAEERAREVSALDRAKTIFFSNISHELRTPLTLLLEPIRQVLESGPLEPQHRELLETARQASGRLQKLVNSLLEFSRIEAGRTDARYLPTDLGILTADLAGMFHSVFERARVDLVVDCPAHTDLAYVDRDMWAAIVLNIVSNALKFTLEGQVTVRLRRPGDRFELEVTDTGCGIPREDLPRIFQRFARVHAARARTVEGSGIGLSLVQELTKLHGGTIEAQSELGVGTTMIVRIPSGFAHLPHGRVGTAHTLPSLSTGVEPFLDEALGWLETGSPAATPRAGDSETRSSERPPAAGDAHAREIPTARERILVVEDNAQMREFLSRILQFRWHVETAPDGAAAIEHVRSRAPDVVVADIMMPRMDGIEMLRALRADAATAKLPVLLLSARAGEDASVEGLQAGANDYLIKPFSQRELVARIQTLLAQAKQHATEQQARARAERDLRGREEFFASLSHELRSPLSSVFAWIDRLRSEKLTRATMLASLDVLELAARALRRLSDDLYDVARGDTESMRIKPRAFATLSPLVAAVVEAFEPAAMKKRITLQQALQSGSGPARVDSDRLQQILANLLSNAIRYTPAGGRIDVSCARRGDTVEIRVSDSGRGIAPEALARVFERYWQAERVPDHDGGLGLGLSITRRLVELHGGQIEALSEGEGTGATFLVRFPVADAREEEPPTAENSEATMRVRDAALAARALAEREVSNDSTAAA
ncbi:MAG TPA: ATP-binding protein [Steroidobacteraceae bacterium]|nr:ATP-binding protein [Steroidobacteraceae bacterium]